MATGTNNARPATQNEEDGIQMKNATTALVMVLVMVVVAAAIFALAGCGSGNAPTDGEPPSSAVSLLEKWQRFEDGNPTLSMTDEQVAQAVVSVLEGATHVAFGHPGPAIPLDASGLEPREVGRRHASILLASEPVTRHNDVPVGEFRVQFHDDDPEIRSDGLAYGGWLEHTLFEVSFYRECLVSESGCVGDNPDYSDAYIESTVYGTHFGTAPTGSGSAKWTGVMVGMEPVGEPAVPARRDVFLGDALVTIDDLVSPDVDVSFTNIHNVTEGTSRNEITWNDLAIDGGMFGDTGFRDTDESEYTGESEYIFGMFNGSRHQEIGGHFRKDGITGAFGAKRE